MHSDSQQTVDDDATSTCNVVSVSGQVKFSAVTGKILERNSSVAPII